MNSLQNQHQFAGKLSPVNYDGQTFTVGARYNVGEVADIPNYKRQPRQLVNDQNKAVFVNGRFSRGIKNFKPSPQVSNKKEIDYLMGEWMPGNIPGEYNWKGLNRNPMHQRHSSIGENVYY